MSIEAQHISKSFDDHAVLSDVSFTIKKGERVGIVGANGSGKSTLLKLLVSIESPDYGQITISKGATVSYVPQAPEYNDSTTIKDILLPLVAPHEEYRIDKALALLNLSDCKGKPFNQLSSGQKTRVYLARIVVEECDVLLLDEPTNHLDVKALEWLENYLKSCKGTICIVSHDRVFLDNVVTRVFELENGKLQAYGGNYSFYKEQKVIGKEAYKRSYEAQQKEIKRLKTTAREVKEDAKRTAASTKPTRDSDKYAATFFAERSSKKKASAAKTIEHKLETIDTLEKPEADPKLKMLFTPHEIGPQNVARFENVSYSTPESNILSDVSFTVGRGSRIALRGPNGTGKTTLIKLLLGQLNPASGEISLGESVNVGYLSQEHESLQSTHTVLNELTEKTGMDSTLAHRLLAWLLVPREKMNQQVNTLSKGEQSKVLLAEIIASGANFIILDEPTNHLDIPAREAVEAALREYTGTLLVISHDRYFIDQINTNQHLYLESGNLKQVTV